MAGQERISSDAPKEWRPSILSPLERVLAPELGVTPEGLQRYDRYMYGFGTSEESMMISLLGLTDSPQSSVQIQQRIQAELQPFQVPRPTQGAIAEVIEDSFIPTQLAHKSYNGRFCFYRASEEEADLVKLVAANFLHYSGLSGISMKQILKSTSSVTGSRGYITRPALLKATLDGVSEKSEMLELTGIDPGTAGRSLRDLQGLEFIDYSSKNSEDSGWVTYKAGNNFDELIKTHRFSPLQQNIIDFIRTNRKTNVYALLEALKKENYNHLVRLLSSFADIGILERDGKQSVAKIKPSGLAFWQEVILPVLQACSGNEEATAQLSEIYNFVRDQPDIITTALNNYYAVMPATHQRPTESTAQQIIEYLQINGPTRMNDLIGVYDSTAKNILRAIIQQERLVKVRRGTAVFYSLQGAEMPAVPKRQLELEYTLPENFTPVEEKSTRSFEDRIADLESDDFWGVFLQDIQTCEFGASFGQFLTYFAEDNLSSRRYPGEGKAAKIGKYGSYYSQFDLRYEDVLEAVDENLRERALEGPVKAMSLLFFSKAPVRIKIELAKKFPVDFGELLVKEIEEDSTAYPDDYDELKEAIKYDDIQTLYSFEIKPQQMLTSENHAALFQLVEKGLHSQERINKGKVPQRDQKPLREAVNQGRQARNQIAQAYLRIVFPIAKFYKNRGLPFADLVEAGNVGLLTAIDNYHNINYQFVIYARWVIKNAIRDEVQRMSDPIRKPGYIHIIANKIRKKSLQLKQERERIGISNIADAVGMEPAKVAEVQNYMRDTLSLDQPVRETEDEFTLGEKIVDLSQGDPLLILLQSIDNDILYSAIAGLPLIERDYVDYFFNISGNGNFTPKQLQKKMNMNDQELQLIHQSAMQKLRDFLSQKL